jgi:hypothetical protein
VAAAAIDEEIAMQGKQDNARKRAAEEDPPVRMGTQEGQQKSGGGTTGKPRQVVSEPTGRQRPDQDDEIPPDAQ